MACQTVEDTKRKKMKVLLIEYNSPGTILQLYSPIRLQQKKKLLN